MVKWKITSILLSGALILSGCATGPKETAVAYPPPEALPSLPPEAYPPPEVISPVAETETPTPTARPATVTFPDPAGYEWKEWITGLHKPVDFAPLGDGSGHILIIEQMGMVRLVQDGNLLPVPFLDITSKVGSRGNEQGLLGIAVHPGYSQYGFFFINYTDVNGNTVIARYQVSTDPNRADPKSEKVLLQVPQPYVNHNGGGLAFGPDGYLYIGLGDGGSQGDPHGNGQSLQTFLGKILRINVDADNGYTIPADNPLVGGGGKPEIWAYGLRNPWRFSFDRQPGDLYIADVGQDKWEEIDFLPAGIPGGSNFGWNLREGAHDYSGAPTAELALVDPAWEYDHSQGCAVIGGYVYRGQEYPEWQGIYLFGDNCSGSVWGLLRLDGKWQAKLLFNTGLRIGSFGQDQTGELYLLDLQQGRVLKLAKK